MIPRATLLAAVVALISIALTTSAGAAGDECGLTPRYACFGIETVNAALSSTQAGAHPDVGFSVEVKQDPLTPKNVYGFKDSYAATREIRFNFPPGLIGDPNVLGVPQQCTIQELVTFEQEGGGCPNGSQVGVSTVIAYTLEQEFHEPVYMMTPPGGDVVARVGLIAGVYPTFVDIRVRSEGDYGLVADVIDASAAAKIVRLENTLWGVPAAESHDTERCTPREALFERCVKSPSRPPGSRPLPFFTNPTRCGASLTMGVSASSWLEPERLDENEVKALFPTITGCNNLPFGPSLTAVPTSHHTASPTGLDMTIRLPKSDGVNVLEPSQARDIRIDFPSGISINPGSADGLAVCSVEQVRFGYREDAHCPDAAKMASTEFEISALPRRMKGAIYLREPEPGNLFRIWVVADDLGAHVKLPGQLVVDTQTGQVKSVLLDTPQAPLREVRLLLKSGFRAPLMTPSACGEYETHYEFTPWAGNPPATGDTPMSIDEGCDTGGFDPKLSAGSTDPTGGDHSPFVFTLTRADGQQNLASLDVTLPKGLLATLAGVPHCEGAAAFTGACPPDSRIGRVIAAIGVGPNPLWVPQPSKRPTAVYLSGPYKGAPLSIVAVVPAQAGPFDLGDEVVRTAIFVDPVSGQATAKSDALPQFKEGIPLPYRTIHIDLDRQGFSLNPTSCAKEETTARVTSAEGAVATPETAYRAINCSRLSFKPKLSLRLFGGTHRGSHPRLKATLKMPQGGANIAGASVALPRSEFVENAHFKTICTRVQFAAKTCPANSIYGFAAARTPLLDQRLEGPVYLRSSNNPLPDLVAALKGPPSLPIEVVLDGAVDSVNGGLRATFNEVPDAPVSEFTLQMQGGDKGLIVNSTNLCASTNKAIAKFRAQNGKALTLHPVLRSSCKKKSAKGQRGRG
jgi:hypothetical protein